MKLALLPAALLLCCAFAHAEGGAEPAATEVPKEVVTQVAHLVALLRDSFATGYPQATQAQTLEVAPHTWRTLVTFTVEGFDMGNTFNQYLAVFEPDANEEGEAHYRLIDVMQIGGDNFRAIDKLQATSSRDEKSGAITFNIPAMANMQDDSPNFPSEPVVIILTLEHDRLAEVKP